MESNHRNLDGFRRNVLVAYGKKSFEEILIKNGRGPEIIMDPRKTRRARKNFSC